MNGNEYGKSGHALFYFHFFEALTDAFKVQIDQGFN